MTDMGRVNQLNRLVVVTFTNAMQELKPKKDMQKLQNENSSKKTG